MNYHDNTNKILRLLNNLSNDFKKKIRFQKLLSGISTLHKLLIFWNDKAGQNSSLLSNSSNKIFKYFKNGKQTESAIFYI